mgnify:CR=1 FL=1
MKKQITLIGILAMLAGCAGTDTEITTEQTLPDIYANAYAEFNELNVKSVKITVEVPEGQETVGISEIRILGK